MTTNVLAPSQYLAIYAAEAAYFAAGFAGVRTGRSYRTGWGGSLVCHSVTYDAVDTIDDVIAGHGHAVTTVLTEDGRHAITTEWHTGPETGESIYAERYELSADGLRRTWHGYVDPTTRKVTQTG